MFNFFFKNIFFFFLRKISSRKLGLILRDFKINIAGKNPNIGEYALDYNNPQALKFLIDVYPVFSDILKEFPRLSELTFLDIGPAFGASAGLISEMHRSHFLGPKVKVDVLDITDERRDFIQFCYPDIGFINKRVEELEEGKIWDIVYCSNAIEHMENPVEFIKNVLNRTRHKAIFIAPYNEACPMSLGHVSKINEETFSNFTVEYIKIFKTEAWPVTADGIERFQILAVLKSS